ncbi:MAG: macrolide 2'-phosphotransferase [Salinibacterium sp.]|nr:MAG: macrolide 2'-phosphotransferase [Salinibacterium sp.]
MARSHLTLAALATSAVAELDVAAAASFGSGSIGGHDGASDFDSALITGRDGRHWIIRVPRNPQAEAAQSADLVALRTFSAGVRKRLPFAVSTFAGQTPIYGTRAIVYEFVYGGKAPLGAFTPGPEGLATSAGRAIAAIHALPTSVITDTGLPSFPAAASLRSAVTIMHRAAATGLVPSALLGHWERIAEDAALWQFQPTVINGALDADSLLFAEGAVTGILGWQDLRVADPARDLQWILGSRNDAVIASTFDAYERARGTVDGAIRQRAALYSELEVAKWLLHGTEARSTEIVDDAVLMLETLTDSIANQPTSNQTADIETLAKAAYR